MDTFVASGLRFEDTELARFLAAHGYSCVEALHACAAAQPERFWREVEQALGLHWATPYQRVCELARGPAWPRWFAGGELDLHDNLVGRIAREDPQRPALLWEGDDGRVRRARLRRARRRSVPVRGWAGRPGREQRRSGGDVSAHGAGGRRRAAGLRPPRRHRAAAVLWLRRRRGGEPAAGQRREAAGVRRRLPASRPAGGHAGRGKARG
jgi:hypothetical protein